MPAAESLRDGFLQLKGFPNALAWAIESVSHQDAGAEYVVHFLSFLVAEKFKTWHVVQFDE
jgi:hypothetical protein